MVATLENAGHEVVLTEQPSTEQMIGCEVVVTDLSIRDARRAGLLAAASALEVPLVAVVRSATAGSVISALRGGVRFVARRSKSERDLLLGLELCARERSPLSVIRRAALSMRRLASFFLVFIGGGGGE